MAYPRTGRPSLAITAFLIAFFVFAASADLLAQDRPPATPPADWGPLSISLDEIEYPYPVEFLDLNLYGEDVHLAYMDVAPVGPANGQTVVLMHGGSYYGWYWEAQIEALTNAGFRVVAEDRIGWGKSSKAAIPLTISLHASNTSALLDHLGVERAAIVGHSMGGQQATRFAFLYAERITHLVMVNPVGLSDNRYGRGFEPFDGEVNVEPDIQAAYEGDVRTEMNRYITWKPEFIEHLRIRHGVRLSAEWPRLALARAMSGHFWGLDSTVDDWPHIATKAMVLGGAEDGPNFPEQARRAADALQNAELFLIPNVGHNPHEEVPEIVNAELIRFLSSDPDTPAGEGTSGGE